MKVANKMQNSASLDLFLYVLYVMVLYASRLCRRAIAGTFRPFPSDTVWTCSVNFVLNCIVFALGMMAALFHLLRLFECGQPRFILYIFLDNGPCQRHETIVF